VDRRRRQKQEVLIAKVLALDIIQRKTLLLINIRQDHKIQMGKTESVIAMSKEWRVSVKFVSLTVYFVSEGRITQPQTLQFLTEKMVSLLLSGELDNERYGGLLPAEENRG
jgi:hypothetical protein